MLTKDLVPSTKRATNPPGTDLHPDANDAMYQGYVEDAFWTAVLKGVITGYSLDASGSAATHEIVPTAPNGVPFSGQLGQLLVEFASLNIISADLMNLQTTFKAVAGPVSFETQRSAQVLVAVLKNIQSQLALSIEQLSSLGYASTTVFDAVIQRTYATALHDTWWVR